MRFFWSGSAAEDPGYWETPLTLRGWVLGYVMMPPGAEGSSRGASSPVFSILSLMSITVCVWEPCFLPRYVQTKHDWGVWACHLPVKVRSEVNKRLVVRRMWGVRWLVQFDRVEDRGWTGEAENMIEPFHLHLLFAHVEKSKLLAKMWHVYQSRTESGCDVAWSSARRTPSLWLCAYNQSCMTQLTIIIQTGMNNRYLHSANVS